MKSFRMLSVIAFGVSALFSAECRAALPLVINSGNDLAQYCNDINVQNVEASAAGNYEAIKGDPKDAMICIMYVRGITDAYQYGWNRGIEGFIVSNAPTLAQYNKIYKNMYTPYIQARPNLKKLFCIPDGVTLLQMQKLVTTYLDSHPDILNKPAAELVIDAFTEAYPGGCEEKPSSGSS